MSTRQEAGAARPAAPDPPSNEGSELRSGGGRDGGEREVGRGLHWLRPEPWGDGRGSRLGSEPQPAQPEEGGQPGFASPQQGGAGSLGGPPGAAPSPPLEAGSRGAAGAWPRVSCPAGGGSRRGPSSRAEAGRALERGSRYPSACGRGLRGSQLCWRGSEVGRGPRRVPGQADGRRGGIAFGEGAPVAPCRVCFARERGRPRGLVPVPAAALWARAGRWPWEGAGPADLRKGAGRGGDRGRGVQPQPRGGGAGRRGALPPARETLT